MSSVPRPLLVKIDVNHYRIDTLSAALIEAGFQLVKAASVKEGLKLARRCHPNLILALDNPQADVDAARWLEMQHSDPEGSLVMTPLLILADEKRIERLKIHELPDRVKVLSLKTPAHELVWHVHQLLAVGSF